MAKTCCGAASCSCVYQAGPGIQITGSGGASDPLVISGAFNFTVLDNTTFNATLTGDGSVADPYELEIQFATTSSVKSLGDWSDVAPTNGQVPVWNNSLGVYVPGSNTPAATGAVQHDTSLNGDGSSGSVLAVRHETSRFTATTATGIGLTDAGINRLVRRFANASARGTASPAVELNSFTVLDSNPGQLYYWDGTTHQVVGSLPTVVGGELLQLSGAYANTMTKTIVKKLSLITNADGTFQVLTAGELAGYSGVLSVVVQPMGSVPFVATLATATGYIGATAWRLSTGAAYGSQAIQALVTAVVY